MMKRCWILCLFSILVATYSHAFSVVYDVNEFYSQYANPTTVLDFHILKDGTVWNADSNEMDFTNELLYNFYGTTLGYYAYNIREDALLNGWQFRSFTRFGGPVYTSVAWTDGAIHGAYPQDSWSKKSFTIRRANQLVPFAMLTNIGFVGIIPGIGEEMISLYSLDIDTISEFSTYFSQAEIPSQVPEPTSVFLLLGGLGVLVLLKYPQGSRWRDKFAG